ncbi:MAG: hypothetical protein H6591_14115 [Flavobacteriales bacterium]|nr:hypothetical protein [Flavobacteriales bacterium]
MVRLAILFLVWCGPLGLLAQDIIVTTAMDTIHCTITLVRDDRIHYVTEGPGARRNASIDKEEVYGYHQQGYLPVILDKSVSPQPDYYASPRRSDGHESYETELPRRSAVDPVRLSFNAGWTWRTAPVATGLPTEWQNHLKGLRNGRQLGADLTAFTKEGFGLGASLGLAQWENSTASVPFYLDNGDTVYYAIRDRVSMGHMSAQAVWRHMDADSRVRFYSRIGIGYSWYRDELAIDAATLVVRSNALSFNAGMGGDFVLSEHLAIGLDLEMIFGIFRDFTVDLGTYRSSFRLAQEAGEAAHRFNLSLGPRLIF